MIMGFGRAVGETMIVLMATGNTAIMDLSIFNGMRPLSANIAVEIPEAPVDSSLYRILFLSAVILFLMTFVVNTIAEVVRQRLRVITSYSIHYTKLYDDRTLPADADGRLQQWYSQQRSSGTG